MIVATLQAGIDQSLVLARAQEATAEADYRAELAEPVPDEALLAALLDIWLTNTSLVGALATAREPASYMTEVP